jgi:hypothetical protein
MIMGSLVQIAPDNAHDHEVGLAGRRKCPVCLDVLAFAVSASVT